MDLVRTVSKPDSVDAEPQPSGSFTRDDDVLQAADAPAQIPEEPETAAPKVDNDDEDEEEDDYEYEDEDDAPFVSGFLIDNPILAATRSEETEKTTSPAIIEDQQQTTRTWRQPTRQAVNMSLRAEQETSGSKRRLAQDLFRIMNQDTMEAGFSLEPADEDSMDRWTIKLFKFDEDSNLQKDMMVLGLDHLELEMSFPDQYPFEPPFVRVVRPRFRRQTGFVMNGALCMELLTKDGWNPINDIESVIVSIRSLLVVGDGRLEAAHGLSEAKYKTLLQAAQRKKETAAAAAAAALESATSESSAKRQRTQSNAESEDVESRVVGDQGGSYSVTEAESAYAHLSDYHKKKGWDTAGWWARKG